MPSPILVSSCLLGLRTRYDGHSKPDPRVASYLRAQDLVPIPVCPEQLAGLPTPRPAACFAGGDGRAVLDHQGRVVDTLGQDLSEKFRLGAQEALNIAGICACREAILKERSPSCGVNQIYHGDSLVPGQGVTAALLNHAGLTLRSEEDLPAPALSGPADRHVEHV